MGRTGAKGSSSGSKGSSGSASRSAASKGSSGGSKSSSAPIYHAGARVGLTGNGSGSKALFTAPASAAASTGRGKAAPPTCGPCAPMTTAQYRTAYAKAHGSFPYAHDGDHTVDAVRDCNGRATTYGTNIAGNYHPVLAQVQRSPNFVGDTKEEYYQRQGHGEVFKNNVQNVAICAQKYDYTNV
ncbi:hypothetical protein ABBQ38_003153 [Trebouxia sp. C0009 RCD-2024]